MLARSAMKRAFIVSLLLSISRCSPEALDGAEDALDASEALSAGAVAIYDDGLRNGWQDWSWAAHSLTQTATVYAGTYATSFDPSAWAGLYFHSASAIDSRVYSGLELWVHGGVTGRQEVDVVVTLGSNLLARARLSSFLPGGAIPAGKWEQARVSFASLGVTGVFDGIYLQAATGATQAIMFVDDIGLSPKTTVPPPPPPPPPPSGSWTVPAWASSCTPLSITRGVSVEGFVSDRYNWRDAECRPRSAALVRNNLTDPAGFFGGYMREYQYAFNGATRVVKGSTAVHPGFGYLVNHTSGAAVSSRRFAGTYVLVLAGTHHAIHEYRWRYAIGGQPATMTVRWFFATGRSHPVWAVTYDLTAAPANSVNADSRSPYGDLRWDGGVNANVDGVGWGDRYKLTSLGQPITLNSGWDYSQPNTVPYDLAWSALADAEMGLVQTQPYTQHDAGGYWFYSAWGTRDTNGPMPPDWNWTFQLNQYELPWGSKSKRIGWGMNYGAVGNTAYPVYGDDARASGYPYQSYAVHIVLDPHSRSPVAAQVRQMEAVQDATLTASLGTVVTSGIRGVGRSDVGTYATPGYNPIYATWELRADANRVTFRLSCPDAWHNPVFVIHNWTLGALPSLVRVAGTALASGSSYYATLDAARRVLWLTLPGACNGAVPVEIAP